MKKIEILSPVGSPQVLRPAVFSGADAVYLGTSNFSAREAAGNFNNEELVEAVEFCHTRGVKVFVALNTLFKDNEIVNLMKTVEFLCKISVDAVIVQDLGLFYLLKKSCPKMPVHCSTQMSLSCASAVQLAESLGAKRAVLAREMSLFEIKTVKENTDIELEVFVHGALCMCVSGQCYFSAMLGSRSGNRGRCAQTCRLPFSTNKIENALSLKDLSYINEIEKLNEIGVDSAKIEGRMKRPEYVAAATHCAKSVIKNGYADFEVRENLEAVFSRSGFTKGYLEGKLSREMFGIRTIKDVEKGNSEVFAELHSLYRTELQKIKLSIEISVLNNQFPVIKATDEDGNRVEVIGTKLVEVARNRALSKSDIADRFSKLGGTPYLIDKIDVETDEVSILPISVLNELRRTMCEKLDIARKKRTEIPFNFFEKEFKHRETFDIKLRAEFKSFKQIPSDVSMFEYIYLPLNAPLNEFEQCKALSAKIAVTMPSIVFSKDDKVREKMEKLINVGINTFSCGNLYAVQLAKELSAEIHGRYSLNILNSYSLKQIEKLGVSCAELSYEISENEIKNIKSEIPRGLMIYGRQSLMLTRNCPVKFDNSTCANCKSSQVLTDRKGINFPVLCSKYITDKVYDEFDFYSEILNSAVLCLQDRLHEVKNIDYGIVRFTTEKPSEIPLIIDEILKGKNTNKEYTRGLFYRGVL